jgi:hypothetical protein
MQKPGKGPAKVIKTTPGTHTLIIANYGFVSDSREVSLSEGTIPTFKSHCKAWTIRFPVFRLKMHPKQAAVLLNGQTPNYLVGHVDLATFQGWSFWN